MKRLILLYCLLATWLAAAQPTDPLVRLRRELARAMTDTARARLNFALSEKVEAADSTLFFARRALALLERAPAGATSAERRRLLRMQAGVLNNIGYGLDAPTAALPYYRRAWRLRYRLADWSGVAETSTNLGYCLEQTGNMRGAIAWYEHGLHVAEKKPAAKQWVSQLLVHLANVYELQGDPITTLRYYQRALRLDEKQGDTLAIADRLRLVSGVLISLNRYAEAETHAARGLQLAEQVGYQVVAGECETQLGIVRQQQGRLSEARRYLLRARARFEQLHDATRLGMAWLHLGQIEEKSQRFDDALHAAQRADALATTAYQTAIQQDVAKLLSDLYHRRGDDRAALAQYQRYILLRDSVQNDKNQAAALQQRLGYEYEKKTATQRATQDKEQVVAQAEIKRQKVLRFATTGGAIGLLLLAFVLWQRFRFVHRAIGIIQAARERAEHERQRSDELLLNILPAETAEELKHTGHAQARFHEQVTVLFADVENFTQLAERLPAQALVAMLDTYFGRFDDLCDAFGLEKIKTIGDSYLLTGGLHSDARTAPAVVVRCALAMQAAADELRAQREAGGQPTLTWRIGIHTGPLVAGVVGRKKFAYDIWGDTVNTAARMEQSSQAQCVNISGATHALVRGQFACTARGALPVRHKADLEMYFVERTVAETVGS